MDPMSDQTLNYLDQFGISKGLLIHLNQSPVKYKGWNLKLNGLNLGFKLENKYIKFNGGPNQTQLIPNQDHNGHAGWPMYATLLLALHAQNMVPTTHMMWHILCKQDGS